jgi:hypothetical protein
MLVYTVWMPATPALQRLAWGDDAPLPWPDAYRRVGSLRAASPEDAWRRGQNDGAPHGSWAHPARVRSLSVGDVLSDPAGHAWRVMPTGFEPVPGPAAGWRVVRTPAGVHVVDPQGVWSRPLTDPVSWTGLPPAVAALARRVWGGVDLVRPSVYVCSPYAARAGETVAQHTLWAQALARLAYDEGGWPVAPHLVAPQWLDDTDPAERAAGLAWGLAQLAGCTAVYVFPVDDPSPGMRAELARAAALGLPLRVAAYAEIADAAARLPGAPARGAAPA